MSEQDPEILWELPEDGEDLKITVTPGDVVFILAVGRPALDESNDQEYFSVTASSNLPVDHEATRLSLIAMHSSLIRMSAESLGMTPYAVLDAISDKMFGGKQQFPAS